MAGYWPFPNHSVQILVSDLSNELYRKNGSLAMIIKIASLSLSPFQVFFLHHLQKAAFLNLHKTCCPVLSRSVWVCNCSSAVYPSQSGDFTLSLLVLAFLQSQRVATLFGKMSSIDFAKKPSAEVSKQRERERDRVGDEGVLHQQGYSSTSGHCAAKRSRQERNNKNLPGGMVHSYPPY